MVLICWGGWCWGSLFRGCRVAPVMICLLVYGWVWVGEVFGYDLGCCVSFLIFYDAVVCLDFQNGYMDPVGACLMVVWSPCLRRCFMGMFCIWSIELALYVAMVVPIISFIEFPTSISRGSLQCSSPLPLSRTDSWSVSVRARCDVPFVRATSGNR